MKKDPEAESVEKVKTLSWSGLLFKNQLDWLSRHDYLRLNLLAGLVGLVSGVIAIGFRYLVEFMRNAFLFLRFSTESVSPLEHTLGWGILLAPAVGGLLVGLLTYFFAREAGGHGVPEVMEAASSRGGKMRGRLVFVKSLASGISIGSGGSAGREGPIVQVGAAAGSYLAQLLKLGPEMTKVLLGCGASAGIAATFNAPLAGVLFTVEVILLEFKTRSFVPLVIATVFATVISRLILGAHPAFIIPAYSLVHPAELFFYLGLGLIAGLISLLYTEVLYGSENLFERIKIPPYLKPAIGGICIGAMACFFPQLLSTGYETLAAALAGELALGLLLFLLFAKIVAVALTLGSGGSGGVFAPALFIGGMLGASFGVVVNELWPGITAPASAYALVGMAAVFAGASRATLTAIIILFEMTLNYNIIVPLMFACVVSDAVAWSISKDSIYIRKLRRRGVAFNQDMAADIINLTRVEDCMSYPVDTVVETTSIQDAWERLILTGHQGFPVVNEEGELTGIITSTDIRNAVQEGNLKKKVSEAETRELIVSYPDEVLSEAFSKMTRYSIGHLPVVDRQDPKQLVGFLTRSNVMRIAHPTL